MSAEPDNNVRVSYGVKELLARIDGRLESIEHKLDSKATASDLVKVEQDMKDVVVRVDKIDREGSIGTRGELTDHEGRLRSLEQWKYGIPVGVAFALLAAVISGLRVILGG